MFFFSILPKMEESGREVGVMANCGAVIEESFNLGN